MFVIDQVAADSWSKSVNDTVNGTHIFTVDGYSLSKGRGPGKYICSDIFTVGGYDWTVYFYPDGKNPEDNSAYVSVFIALASEGTDVRALFELTLLDKSGKMSHKVHSHFDRAMEDGPYTLKNKGSMWGYKRFFKRAALESSDYLSDDCLSMHITVGVVRNRIEGPKKCSIPISASDIGQSLTYLFDSKLGCDINFQVGDENFKAHKLILAARSNVFRAMFFGNVGDTNMDKVILEDIEPSIFKAMLLFIYSDRIPDSQEYTFPPSTCPTAITLQHLLSASDRFGLDRLKQLCEAKLCEEVTVETVATTLSLADQHRCSQLKTVCLKLAAEHLGAVMKSEGFRYLKENCKSLLTELLETVASVDNNESQTGRKRSGSSNIGLAVSAAEGSEAEDSGAGAPNDRRMQRRL